VKLSNLFRHYYFGIGLFLLVVQQLLVASSVYFLAMAAENLQSRTDTIFFFGCFVLTLVLPYLPGLLSHYFMDLWSVSAVRIFQVGATKSSTFNARDFARADRGNENTALFSNTGPAAISEFCFYTQDLAATGLNSVLTIIAVASVVDFKIGVAYAFSLIACACYVFFLSDIAQQASERAEIQRISLLSVTERVWPNLSLRNNLTMERWLLALADRYDAYFHAFGRERIIRYVSNFTLSMLSVLPTAVVLIWLAVHSSNDSILLAAMLVTAPRVFQLLTMLGQFASLIFDWNHVKGRLAVLSKLHDQANTEGHQIEFGKIDVMIDGKVMHIGDEEQFADIVRNGEPTRILVRGPNGSGKTTLLLALKDRLAELAFHLPPSSGLMFGAEIERGSTGERKLAEIEVVLSNAHVKFFLLDEWDANLDRQNMKRIDHALNTAAKSICIVEVRHRVN
jgi:hypothetical protein